MALTQAERAEINRNQQDLERRVTDGYKAGDAILRTDLDKIVDDAKDAIKLADGFDTLQSSLTFICALAVALGAVWELFLK